MDNESKTIEKEENAIRNEIERYESLSPDRVRQVFLAVIFVWTLGFVPIAVFGISQEAGLIGDSHGAVNSFFSAMAFAFVVFALLSQKDGLWYQRKEIALSLLESKRARKEYEDMAKALAKQVEWQFQATYLEALNQRIDTIRKLAELDHEAGRTSRHWPKEAFKLTLYVGDVFEKLSLVDDSPLERPPEMTTAFANLKWISERLVGHIIEYSAKDYKKVVMAMNQDLAMVEASFEYVLSSKHSEYLLRSGSMEDFIECQKQLSDVASALELARTSGNKDVMDTLKRKSLDYSRLMRNALRSHS